VSRTFEKSRQAGDLADRTAFAIRNHSGDTAPESHRLPHQFPAPAKGVLKRIGISPTAHGLGGSPETRKREGSRCRKLLLHPIITIIGAIQLLETTRSTESKAITARVDVGFALESG